MSAKRSATWRNGSIEPFWYVIILLALLGAALFAYHQITGFVPDRVAFRIPYVNLDVYWYGIIITAGIALGAYVTTRLARRRALELFVATVPKQVRHRPIAALNLPDEVQQKLFNKRILTQGELLFRLGFESDDVGLDSGGRDIVRRQLSETAAVQEAWLIDPPWRVWDPGHVWMGLAWCLILALIGARLYHVLTPSPSMAGEGITSPLDYFRNPLELINLRRGGLGIYGGIAGGALGLFIYSRRARIPMLPWADIAVVGVALGQAVGRWANFINQELYGSPTNLPWAITIEQPLPGYTEFTRFHPAFLYESLWNFLAFLVLYRLATAYQKRLMPGDLMALYIILYAVGRTLLEQVRLDSRTLLLGNLDTGIAVATAVSLVLALAMGFWIFIRHRRLAR